MPAHAKNSSESGIKKKKLNKAERKEEFTLFDLCIKWRYALINWWIIP